ncbi:pseudaminic acid biosynthesis-associated methylase [Chloroflexota bacterium]
MNEHVTKQMNEWAGDFGKEYTDRNVCTLSEMEAYYKNRYGVSRTDMNDSFIGSFDKNIRILEVGTNVGTQLLCLQRAGFKNLYGIELQTYAIELAKIGTKEIDMVQGSAFNIPFQDDFFDLVFTSGVLIHISPEDIIKVQDEMYRCAKQYIWGFEYYSDKYMQVKYREEEDLLWKADFSDLFLERFNDLELTKIEYFKYRESDNVDAMFLLEKRTK